MDYIRTGSIEKYLSSHDGQSSHALVTGASDGIGAALAIELASHGFNLILHGRNPSKLNTVRESILKGYPTVTIRTLIADASLTTPTVITDLITSISTLPITVLINNVGGTGSLSANFKTFSTHTPIEIDSLININIRFTIHLTHAVLPLLTQQNQALIMNIGSGSYKGLPYLPVYSSTKAFIHAFSNALRIELGAEQDTKGIEVLEVLVASVQTQQNQTAHATLFVPSAQTMAKAAVSSVGRGGGRGGSVVSYWPHWLQAWLLWVLPAWLGELFIVGMLKPLAGKTERVW